MKSNLKKLLLAIVGLLLSTTALAHSFGVNGIYYNYLDGQKYIWDEDKNKYTEIYQIQNNTEYSQINLSYGAWPTNNHLLKIGGEDDLLFYKDDITKMQLDQGYILPTNNGDEFKPRTIRVDLQFKNDSEERKANLKIKNVQLKFWYKIVFEEYTVDMDVKPTLERHRAKCTKVTDADTLWIEGVDKSIRLAGINAYETTTEIGRTAKEYVKDKCLNKTVTAYIELSNPDFTKLAASYGIDSVQINTLSDLEFLLEKDLKGPILVEVKVDSENIPLPE